MPLSNKKSFPVAGAEFFDLTGSMFLNGWIAWRGWLCSTVTVPSLDLHNFCSCISAPCFLLLQFLFLYFPPLAFFSYNFCSCIFRPLLSFITIFILVFSAPCFLHLQYIFKKTSYLNNLTNELILNFEIVACHSNKNSQIPLYWFHSNFRKKCKVD